MRILLIDDSAAYREEFAILLADAKINHTVLDYVSNVREAAPIMAAGTHDVYFVDYRLPGGDGLALVRKARASGITKPIIVLTGYGSPLVDFAAEEAGATDYLPKGEFSPQMLDRAIRYAMRNAEAVRVAKESSSLFKMAQEAGGIGAWSWDIGAGTYIWSPRMREIFGVGLDDEVGYQLWLTVLHPDDRDAAQAALAAAVGKTKPFDTLYRILRKDSARPEQPPVLRWVSAKGEVVHDPAGAPLRMVGLCVDVTDQQDVIRSLQSSHSAATSSLQASEARFQTYFETSTECLFHVRVDPDGQFRYETVNPAGLAQMNASMATLRGRTPEEALGAQAGGQITGALRRVCETGAPYHYQPTFEIPGGAAVFDAVYAPLRGADGSIVGVLGSARDITERRRLEDQLHQSQKMEALGQLAGGVAHDFNNLLTGILGCFELLGRYATTEREKRLVAQGCRAVERSTALTARLLAFSRHQPLATQAVDINASLEEITEMLGRTLGTEVRIGKDLAADLWPASTDRNQIELAILNLGINARDAMPLGGSLTISTRNETLRQARGDLRAGDYVAIAVADSGSGMSPEVLARVQEPFFTTKGPGKGTGLGLSMVAGVTKQLGGGLTIESEPGKGTCVTLFLPRAAAAAPEADLDACAKPVRPMSILLVDDDPNTHVAIDGYAVEAGHEVIHARRGAQALAMLDEGRVVDIMIIDATLPGLLTAEVIARALERRPGLPVLVISGQTTRSEGGVTPVLAKPFRRDAFNKVLATLLKQVPAATNVVTLRQDRPHVG